MQVLTAALLKDKCHCQILFTHFIVLLRVSFEALASCLVLLLIAGELIYLAFISPVKASGCLQIAAITLV